MNRGLCFWRSRRYRGSPPKGDADCCEARGGKSVFLKFLSSFKAPLNRDAILAAIALTISWGPLSRKRISKLTAQTLPWYLRLYGVMVGAIIPAEHHKSGLLCGIPRYERFSTWTMADLYFMAITQQEANYGRSPSTANPCWSTDFKRSRRYLCTRSQGSCCCRWSANP